MNLSKMHRIRSTGYDIAFAILMFLFVMLATMSPTVGNTGFYNRYLSNGDVTAKVQEAVNEEMKSVASITGIEEQAFKYAVGEKKIASTQKEMIKAAFDGNAIDYSDSANIESCYREGIKEFYRSNGMLEELDEKALETAVPLACNAFNEALGIKNTREFKSFAYKLSHLSIMLTVGVLILAVVMAFVIFSYSQGRTKVFSHYGSALISSGLALVLLFVANMVFQISDKLYLTNNEGINIAIARASNMYFLILAAFGVAFIIGGVSMMTYVYKYYTGKMKKQKQEVDINKNLIVSGIDGDVSMEEIVETRRKARQQRHKN